MIGDEEREEVLDTLRSDWITTGPKTKAFEQKFAAFLRAEGALALNSCTAGLHLALVVNGIGPGDGVITTPMTFCASVNVIEHVGARPVLADVESDTLNIDPEKILKVLKSPKGRKAKAILAVHYAGHPCEMAGIEKIAQKYGLAVIEDAAHAFPAKYKGCPVGSGKNLVAFSFYATKNLTTGEGGMLTGDRKLLEKARILSLHGMSRDAWKRYDKKGSWKYQVLYPGFKYNMSDIQAAIGIRQLEKIHRFQKRRYRVVEAYNQSFDNFDALEIPAAREGVEHAWHLYVLRLNPGVLKISRDQFIEELKKSGVASSVHFIPVHLHPFYRKKYGYKPHDFPVAFNEYQRMLSLPLNPRLSDRDVHQVTRAVCKIAKRFHA